MSTTTEWAPSPEHPGYTEKTIKKGNCTIQILRPILTEKERAKIEVQIKTRAEKILRDYYYRKEENTCQTTSQ